uniref:Uncharacterized protein n=1 Tax=Octopus bimaculoides TaxID=37653 RepID=A0A0L8ID32_OCTBM
MKDETSAPIFCFLEIYLSSYTMKKEKQKRYFIESSYIKVFLNSSWETEAIVISVKLTECSTPQQKDNS